MTDNNRISAAQLFCLLTLCSLSAELVFPYLGGYTTEQLLAVVIAAAVRAVVAFPIIIYSFCGDSLYAAIAKKNRILGWIAALIAFLMLSGYAAITVYNTVGFVQRNMLPNSEVILLIAIVIAFSVYCAVKGIEGISRASVVIFVISAIIIITVVLADIPHMEAGGIMPTDRITGIETDDGIVSQVLKRLLCSGEYLAFAVLLPRVRREHLSAGKAALFYALANALVGVGLFVLYSVVLGELYSVSEFPFAAVSQLADVVLIKRMDGIACAFATILIAITYGSVLLMNLFIKYFGTSRKLKEVD